MKSNVPFVALITGAARRIGAVIAKTLHQHGYNVIIHYRHSQNDAEKLCHLLNGIRPSSAHLIHSDFDVPENIADVITQSLHIWQRLDVVINNASTFTQTHLEKTTTEQWDTLINSNLKAPYFLAQQAYPHLKKTEGCIINIADIHGIHPLKNYPVYSIAKAGLIMLTKALAREFAPEIRVNAVAPGPTLPPEGDNSLSEQRHQELIDRTVLKRLTHPREIAEAILFLIQQKSMTGEILKLDGGRYL
jgi:pteridine reductase